jgi:hypothetical protein
MACALHIMTSKSRDRFGNQLMVTAREQAFEPP